MTVWISIFTPRFLLLDRACLFLLFRKRFNFTEKTSLCNHFDSLLQFFKSNFHLQFALISHSHVDSCLLGRCLPRMPSSLPIRYYPYPHPGWLPLNWWSSCSVSCWESPISIRRFTSFILVKATGLWRPGQRSWMESHLQKLVILFLMVDFASTITSSFLFASLRHILPLTRLNQLKMIFLINIGNFLRCDNSRGDSLLINMLFVLRAIIRLNLRKIVHIYRPVLV